tara:strand:+ start:3615 stop:4271 length:657 start_codon:yes stop_codon:yes gene_type:complete
MSKDNMKLWYSVCVTDPCRTKKVSQRGGFTAICAQSQFKEATEQFGAYGQGWWVEGEKFTMITDSLCLYQATMVICKKEKDGTKINPFSISSSISIKQGAKEDTDFAKKVSTDAITKALSRMGFNSDVFEGKFDDNKYVASLEEKKKEAENTKKVMFFKNTAVLLEGGAPATKEAWLNYIKLLCNGIGVDAGAIEDIAEDDDLWDKLADEAVRSVVLA